MKDVPILFVDLDGTVRHGYDELGRFVNCPEDVQVFEEVPGLLRRYKTLGWRTVGVTNQGGVALGYVTLAFAVSACRETLRQAQALDTVMMCPHHPNAKDPHDRACWCRKPKHGLLIGALARLAGLDLTTSERYPLSMMLMVGDRPEDEECAANAGISFLDAKAWRAGDHLRALSVRERALGGPPPPAKPAEPTFS